MPPKVPSRVVVHPIVLLSVVDHFNRLSKIGNQRRVVGILLGSWKKGGVVDIATSFAGEGRTVMQIITSCGIATIEQEPG